MYRDDIKREQKLNIGEFSSMYTFCNTLMDTSPIILKLMPMSMMSSAASKYSYVAV